MTQQKLNSLSRRHFLGTAAMIPAALLAGQVGDAFGAGIEPPRRKYPIGLELYSVRGELAKDLPGTLRAVAKMGYEVVEFYAPYFGWTIPYAKEVRTIIDDLGMRCYSTHNHIELLNPGENQAKTIELNQILGARYVIMASAPRTARGLEGWKKFAEQLTAAVEILKPHGLFTGFHNHQTEWAKVDGEQRVMDVLAANTPKEFALQFDVGTCMEAGADPIAWVKANPGRIKSVHVKDWAPGDKAQEKGYRVLFTEGVTPWKEIFAACESVGGVEYYLLEQEGSRFSEFETAQKCIETWRKMRG